MYIPKDPYLWDFWLLRKQENYHLFYLQAPRGLSDPEMRHGLATVGYAVSRVIARDGAFYMLYTGTNRAEEGRVQRIGLATLSDLLRWKKHPANPLIEAVPRWYEDEKASPFSERAWRDPYVMHYEPENVFYTFITARTKQGPVVDRGCIALARSSDLVDWEVFPPVQLPQTFMQLEVPQCVVHQGMCYLLFSVNRAWYTSGPATQASAPPLRELTIWSPAVFSVPTAEHGFRLGTRLVLTTGPS